MMETKPSPVTKVIARALGEELRRAREALGLSRQKFVLGLPSGIGERTLLSYEHGLRMLTVARFLELCEHLQVDATTAFGLALQRAKLYLNNLTLQVDLTKVIHAPNPQFRPLVPWARNRLRDTPDGIAHLTPSAIRELAAFLGQSQDDLAHYLATFDPAPSPVSEAA
jgi:transcriptional regulator with XRE-family HTH domain